VTDIVNCYTLPQTQQDIVNIVITLFWFYKNVENICMQQSQEANATQSHFKDCPL